MSSFRKVRVRTARSFDCTSHDSREYAAFERERIPRHDCAGDAPPLVLCLPRHRPAVPGVCPALGLVSLRVVRRAQPGAERMPQRERRVPALAAEAQLDAWGGAPLAIHLSHRAEDEWCEDTATMP